ncbi:MAG TPA: 2Fe-2S iron-sulfur cluster-binding protein [Haliangiales bacterium]|nr:2Fe-2S iron-sulfur cluster-binding protein [Haliangiales bacterium]
MPKVKYLPEGIDVVVEPGTTILDAARKCGAPVGSACGGNLACSTCHVWVRKGFDSLSEMEDGEDDILDKAFDVRPMSRLGCQAKVADEDVDCEVTRESRQAFYDEHPDERPKAAG